MIRRLRRETTDALVIALAAAALAAALTYAGALGRWDWSIYDAAIRAAGAPAPEEIVVVSIDDDSLERIGRWPWTRYAHAALVEGLDRAGVAAIGYDILFAESDPDPDADLALEEAIRRSARVVMPLVPTRGAAPGQIRETTPLDGLTDASATLGHVELPLDPDGLVRRTYLRAGLGTPRWSSFAAAVLGTADGANAGARLRPGPAPPGARWVREDPMLIPYLGPPGHFRRVPAHAVIMGEVDAGALDGALALVGVTAAGLGNPLPTPLSGGASEMPSVEVIANELAALRAANWPTSLPALLAAALAAALAFAPALAYLSSSRALVLAAGVTATLGPVALALAMMTLWSAWWPPLATAAVGAGGFLVWTTRRLASARRAVDEGRQRAEATLRSIGDAVVTTDAEGRVQYMNPVAEALTGWSPGEAVGRRWDEVLDLGPEHAGDPVRTCIAEQRASATLEPVRLLGRDGREYGVHACASPVETSDGGASGAVIALRDVTEATRLQREIVHQASHDTLTDLPNRSLLLDRLQTAVVRAARHGHKVAVLFIDVDRFKLVNDGYGHAFGDRLLIELAARLRRACRAQDTVARLGGDEFVVVLEELHSEHDAAAAGQKLRETVARPLMIDGREVFATGSIGVSIFPKDGADAGELLKHADAAMYRAKEAGRNSVEFFSEALNALALRRIDLEQRLRGALARHELSLHYQPLVKLGGGQVVGAEALLRWVEPQIGTIAPAEFISVAEDSGLITPIGEWVLDAACRQAAQWRDGALGDLRVAVNVSPRQLLRQDMAQLVESTLARTRLDPTRLELEITESVMMHESDRYERALSAVRALGVHISVDDFGTGYSSLSYLKRFPVDRVKIDRSFVHDIGTTGEGTAISRAVIAMAQSLDMGVVAEGLESRAQLDFLRDRECEEGQGFLLCPPMTPEALDAWLREVRDGRQESLDALRG